MKAIKVIAVLILMLALTVPAMAHNGKGPGGKGDSGTEATPTPPDIPDTGTLYGDLYVILRHEDGTPVFDENLCVQPISSVNDSTTIETNDPEDPLVIEATAGEPFTLATYTDPLGNEILCELTEEMADWVETVDFGRLNLGRAPDNVIAHAFDEAIKKMNTATGMYLDPAGRLVLTLPDTESEDSTATVDKTIDAPAEALALYIAMMTEGDWITEDTTPIVKGGLPTGKGPPEGDGPSSEPRPVLNADAILLLNGLGFTHLGVPYDPLNTVDDGAGDLNNEELLLAASLLAAAADKTGTINLDKVIYINFIYGINQLGTLTDGIAVDGKSYFDFGAFTYDRGGIYATRTSGNCGPGWVWVLQPEMELFDPGFGEMPYLVEKINHFETQCMEIMGYENAPALAINAVHFTNMVESYTTAPNYTFNSNVRGFAQAADDALQVIEYIHNYKIPEVLYP